MKSKRLLGNNGMFQSSCAGSSSYSIETDGLVRFVFAFEFPALPTHFLSCFNPFIMYQRIRDNVIYTKKAYTMTEKTVPHRPICHQPTRRRESKTATSIYRHARAADVHITFVSDFGIHVENASRIMRKAFLDANCAGQHLAEDDGALAAGRGQHARGAAVRQHVACNT